MAVPSQLYSTLTRDVDPALVSQIRVASQASGSDFGLLMAQAQQESSFRPDAKAPQGSAQGLFQFIGSTWLDMMRRFGAKYGEGALAQQITVDATGKPHVADPATRQRILALRNDPMLSAALAGEYAKLNASVVERALGHKADPADLYMAHFLGPGGATAFLKALETHGSTPAAALLPEAAQNNRAIFYDDETGRARSVAEIYQSLSGRINAAAASFGTALESGVQDADAATATVPATGTVTVPSTDNLAALKLSTPVASILDTLTLAALRLVGGASHPRRQDESA